MSITRVNLIFFVRDPAAATRFYRNVLAREPTLEVPGMTEFRLGEGVVLGLMPERGIVRLLGASIDPAAAGGAPRAELYLLVDDPAAYHARALQAGATELSAPSLRAWGEIAGYCRDPDGHLLAFAATAPDGVGR